MSVRTLLSAGLVSLGLGMAAPAGAADAPDADMARVLAALQSLDPKPLQTLTPEEARKQPNAAAAVKKVLDDDKVAFDPREGLTVTNSRFADMGTLRLRYYTPEDATKTSNLPVIVYYRGGGWVLSSQSAYDASAGALARKLHAAVVAVNYVVGPEHKFPAAHDEAIEGYKYVLKHAAQWGYDPSRIALVGESAGGNLAVNTAIAARDQNLTRPVAVVSIYPVAETAMDTPSYGSEADARPLGKAAMQWFLQTYTNGGSDLSDPRLNLVAADLRDLPPITIINAAIDPLRSDGDLLEAAIAKAGGTVTHRLYTGVTHEFFGMAPAVAKSGDAQDFAVEQLKQGFATPSTVMPLGQ